jgi:hypothetical protein
MVCRHICERLYHKLLLVKVHIKAIMGKAKPNLVLDIEFEWLNQGYSEERPNACKTRLKAVRIWEESYILGFKSLK